MACNNQLIGGNNNPFSVTTYGAVSGAVPMNSGFNAPVDQMGGCPSSQYKFVCQCDQTFILTNNSAFDCANPNQSYNPLTDCESDGIYDLQKGSSDNMINGCSGSSVGGVAFGGVNCVSTYYQNGYVAGTFHPPTNECNGCVSPNIEDKGSNPLMPTILKSDTDTTANTGVRDNIIADSSGRDPQIIDNRIPAPKKQRNTLVIIGAVVLLLLILSRK